MAARVTTQVEQPCACARTRTQVFSVKQVRVSLIILARPRLMNF